MVTSVIEIWNMALSATGGRGAVTSEVDSGREPDLCRLWYPTVRDMVLKSASWPCATKHVRLALEAERDEAETWDSTAPPPTWRYSYGLPSDLLAPRHLASFLRFDRAFNGTYNILMTNDEDAILKYTFQQEDISKWDAGLVTAVYCTLAHKLCMPLNAKQSRSQELKAEATEAILLSRTDFANEADDQYETLPPWIAVRGYAGLPSATRYFYPYEDISAIGA